MYQTEIHVKGKMNPNWAEWFEELQVRDGGTDEIILIGKLPDMAAIYGIVSRLSNLVIPLISVSCHEETNR